MQEIFWDDATGTEMSAMDELNFFLGIQLNKVAKEPSIFNQNIQRDPQNILRDNRNMYPTPISTSIKLDKEER